MSLRLELFNGLFPQQTPPPGCLAARSQPDSLLVGLFARWRWPVINALLLLWVFSLWTGESGSVAFARGSPAASSSEHSADCRRDRGAQWRPPPPPGSDRVSEWNDPDRFLAGLDLYRAGGHACCSPVVPAHFSLVSRRKVSVISTKRSSSAFLPPQWPVRRR